MAGRGEEVIGRAFRRSLLVIALIAIGGVAVFLLTQDSGTVEVTREKDAGEITGLPKIDVDIPSVRFTDVTEAAGIDFVNVNGATGEKLLPETMGGGVAFLDYDGDGDPDLLFVSGRSWTGEDTHSSLRLFANDGDGKFTDRRRRNCRGVVARRRRGQPRHVRVRNRWAGHTGCVGTLLAGGTVVMI